MRLLGFLIATILAATLLTAAPATPAAASGPGANGGEETARVKQPSWAKGLPARTTQVVRTVSSRAHCKRIWCTVTQAWRRDKEGRWIKMREFRSTIGSRGWGKQREGDRRSPGGVFKIKVTFTTGKANAGEMPWRRRKPTSVVSAAAGPHYNTWVEIPGVTSGNRPSMRSGWVLDFNNVRLRPDVGKAPVPGKGSGIFYHTSRPGARWAPTLGCTQVGNPKQMRWLLRWLDPEARPRVVQNR